MILTVQYIYHFWIVVVFLLGVVSIALIWVQLLSKGDKPDYSEHKDLRPKTKAEIMRAIEKLKREGDT